MTPASVNPTTANAGEDWQRVSRPFAWLVFALTFGLLLSDYMSRQVLNAVFPLLKAEWQLSDAALGSLSSVVSIAVGLFAFPLSLMADRWGRIRSIAVMAAIWSLATLACAFAANHGQLFAARFMVGLGEAAYASVGLALIISIFPPHLRSTVTGAFMCGSMFGSVLGIGLGGVLATHFGWRSSFAGMAIYGMVLTVLFALAVKPKQLEPARTAPADANLNDEMRRAKPQLRSLFSTRSVLAVYLGSGLQLIIPGAMLAWLPSFLNRSYDLSISAAGGVAAIFVLCSALGMPLCGALVDRLCRHSPTRKMTLAVAFCLICACALTLAFQLPPSKAQLICIGVAMFFGTGTIGPTGTMVANLTPAPIHSTAMATWALSNNLIGLAPGPFLVGMLADRIGLTAALQFLPLAGLAAVFVLLIGIRHYRNDLQLVQQQQALA